MGLFYFTNSENKDELCKAIVANIEMFRDHPTCTYMLEAVEEYLNKLKIIGKKAKEENDVRNDAYYAKKASYPLCTNCDNKKFREREEINNEAGIYASYCSIEPDEVFHKEIGKKFKDYDEGHVCPSFRWAYKE